jgi:hypothetical protein
MKNLLQHIQEKLQISRHKQRVIFDDIPEEPVGNIYAYWKIQDALILYQRNNNNEYYDLSKIYGDNLPVYSYMDKSQKYVYRLQYYGADENNVFFVAAEDKHFKFRCQKINTICDILKKDQEFEKGVGVMKYICDEIHKTYNTRK